MLSYWDPIYILPDINYSSQLSIISILLTDINYLSMYTYAYLSKPVASVFQSKGQKEKYGYM